MILRGLCMAGSRILLRNRMPISHIHKKFNRPVVSLLKPCRWSFSSDLPPHQVLNMPALSPTMAAGKVVKWYKKEGDAIYAGDILCDVYTDKATVPFEMVDKGFIAKILLKGEEEVKVGEPVVVVVSKKDAVGAFGNYSGGSGAKKETKSYAPEKKADSYKKETKEANEQTSDKKASYQKDQASTAEGEYKGTKKPKESQEATKKSGDKGYRQAVSPLARRTAYDQGVEVSEIQGSGPGGRVIKQDVEEAAQQKATAKAQKQAQYKYQTDKEKAPAPKKKTVIPDNPFEYIPLTSTRKTIAARLVESKTTIPHYYITIDINMDNVMKIREDLNNENKDSGVKISINDIIMKASALASRDYPDVNVQWGDKSIKKFRHVDMAMAVATDKGLITPIIFRADTKGLLYIAKESKDLAKRARESKLLPQEYQGGTCSVSNLGMFGINTVTSIINPPHSLILGVGKTEKRIVFDENAKDAYKPYKVANMMTVTVSADHRVVDGALAGQWLVRVKKYLESPMHMLL